MCWRLCFGSFVWVSDGGRGRAGLWLGKEFGVWVEWGVAKRAERAVSRW